MADDCRKHLVFSMMQFLSDQISSGSLSDDSVESIEVAIQCLESSFGVSTIDSHLAMSRPLLEIFTEVVDSEAPKEKKAPSDEDKQAAEVLKNDGNRLMKEEKFQEAIQSYSRAIFQDGTNAVYYCNRAAAYTKIEDHMAAVADCKKALSIDEQYSKAYGRMGLAYSILNQHQEAKECYQKAVDLEPDNESYINNLRVAEEKLKQTNVGGGGGGPTAGIPGLGGLDVGSVLNNPALMNMATQLLSNSQMQNMMANLMAGQDAGGGGMEALLRAGQQLAQQMQSSNPELVETLRRQMGGDGGGGGGPDPPPGDGDNTNS